MSDQTIASRGRADIETASEQASDREGPAVVWRRWLLPSGNRTERAGGARPGRSRGGGICWRQFERIRRTNRGFARLMRTAFPWGRRGWFPLKSLDATVGRTDGQRRSLRAGARAASQFNGIAINCAHLGSRCGVPAVAALHGVRAMAALLCDGSRASGPPERGLFTYDYKIAGGQLQVMRADAEPVEYGEAGEYFQSGNESGRNGDCGCRG